MRDCKICGRKFENPSSTRPASLCGAECRREYNRQRQRKYRMKDLARPQPASTYSVCATCGSAKPESRSCLCPRCREIITKYNALGVRAGGVPDARSPPRWNPKVFACEVCDADVGPGSWHRHHVVPRRQGGSGKRGNLVLLCAPCHLWVHELPIYRGKYSGPAAREDFVDFVKLLK